ncbi:MAG: hypothetical protein U0359_19765, partial [Byssovorax sp.]
MRSATWRGILPSETLFMVLYARILEANNILVASTALKDDALLRDFFGAVIEVDEADDLSRGLPTCAGKTVYLCGDIERLRPIDLQAAERVFVIRELSRGYDEAEDGKAWTLIGVGRVPILVHGAGVYYRRFFDPGLDHFNRISTEHTF